MDKVTKQSLNYIMNTLLQAEEDSDSGAVTITDAGVIALLNIFDKPAERKLILSYFPPSVKELQELVDDCKEMESDTYAEDAESENSTGNIGEYGDMLRTLYKRAELKIKEIKELDDVEEGRTNTINNN